MFFLKFVLFYLLLLVGYIAYITSQNTPDHWHAASLFVGSLGAFVAAIIAAFKDLNLSKEKELSTLDIDGD